MARVLLNDGWGFSSEYQERMCTKDYDGKDMEEVRLPHTCKEVPYHYFDEQDYQMISAYRKVIFVPKEWADKTILFTCEGSGHESVVYVNGKMAGKHSCGYTAFTFDISSLLQPEEDNVILVKVDSRESLKIPPFGFVIDYMTFGGMYRQVYLDVLEKEYIEDVFVKAEDDLQCEITLSSACYDRVHTKDSRWFVRGYLCRAFTDVCPPEAGETYDNEVLLFEEPVLDAQFIINKKVDNRKLWNLTTPYLYRLRLELICEDNGECSDIREVRFGFRKVEYKADGFYLNHKKVKIRGLNRHQSYPYVGYAMPESMQKLDADILKKELGCNSVRTSHYPQSHDFINRCDELGLLVFMEIPGWQHIGDGEWKMQACQNVRDMILQYRNHPSIMIWGVRINESQDDDAFYEETNRIAHALDDTRPTGGVRNFKKSHLFEDVYTYNDFLHNGTTAGCEQKSRVTSDMAKGYLITEYNGHMYPTKPFDWEEHRLQHALRHANVLDAVGKQEDIAGSFGWCMFDYNTHKDFGSGDRICYHGVLDMFRNPKQAAAVYASQQEEQVVLELSSSMDIGEHPATNLGPIYLFTNADSVKMYKNNYFIKEYKREDSTFKGIAHGPILVDDFVGDMLVTKEGFSKKQSEMIASAMNYIAVHGYQSFPPHIILTFVKAVLRYKMNPMDLVHLYTKYVGNWGETATEYRFEAICNGKVVKTLIKQPMRKLSLDTKVSHTELTENNTYDVAAIRIRAVDENGNLAPYYQEALRVETEGPITIIGPDMITLKGGMGGIYIKTTGESGKGKVRLSNGQIKTVELDFNVITNGGKSYDS